ncbi:MAG: thioredoxin family protein [Candidatus Thorarchaeota archaeon]
MVRDVSPEEAADAIANTKVLFVDCWAPWCGPCLALAPTMEELDSRYADNDDIGFIKINTQNYREFAMQYNIAAIPCVLVYKDGQPATFEMDDPRMGGKIKTDRLIGLRPIEHYEKVIEQLL